MGRLDKFYSEKNISLNEKTNPPEQFKQLIEETGVCGPFQQFLEDHWQNIKIFSSSDFDKIRQILKTATLEPTFKEQVITFIRGFDTRYNLSLIFVYTLESEPREIPTEIAQRLTFAKNVATEVFPNDPLGFSRCFDIWDRMPEHIFLLNAATRFYGKDFFLSPEFVRSMDEETVWNVFWELFNQETIQDKSAFASYLEEWHNTNRVTFESEKFKFLQFIKTFLDVQVKQKSAKKSFDCLRRIEISLKKRLFQFDDNSINDNHWWFEAVRQELDVLWCLNIVSEQELPPDIEEELAKRYHANYLFFMPGQSQTTIHAMIKWSLKKDLEEWLRSERNTALLYRFASNVFSPLWYMSPYRSVWLKEFYDFLQALPIEQRCRFLSIPLGSAIFTIRDGDLPIGIIPPEPDDYKGRDINSTTYSYRVEEEDINNYDSYFKNLIDSKTLPKDKYFEAVENSILRFSKDISFVLNHSNIVIGQLRGFVATNDAPVPFEKLDNVWWMLEVHEPKKAFIHRLMLLRASASPCCDEKLEIKGTGPCSFSVREIVKRLTGNRSMDSKEVRAEDIRKWFAEYCISRLQLRKNEKTDKDVYRNEQIVEPSPIWREAYLHAVSELGTDLDGRIHKLAHFIRKCDPDSDVRDTASKCYKASRRKHIKSQDHDEIVRSLIAAYWWLLMAHIKALGIEPDHEGALQSRRRQLRR
jgi:hypothetical protein